MVTLPRISFSGSHKKCIFLACLFGLLLQGGRAQVFEDQDFRRIAFQGIEKLYNFEHEAAEGIFEGLHQSYADHPAPYFLLALNRWWQSYISPNMETYHPYIEKQLDTALVLNRALEGDPAFELEYTFLQFMCHAFLARLSTLRKEWWKAASAGRRALPYLKEGFDFTRRSPEFYFGSGIYHYYASEYPKAHPYVKPFMIFFPGADAQLGKWELRQASNTPNYAQVEAMFYLGDIYLKEGENEKKGLDLYTRLAQRFPGNTWFQMEYGRALVLNGKYDLAIPVLQRLTLAYETLSGQGSSLIYSSRSPYSSFLSNRSYYFLGRALLEKGLAKDEAAAAGYLDQSLKLADRLSITDDEFLPGIFLFRAWAADRMGDRPTAIRMYQEVMDAPQNKPFKDRAAACLEQPCTDRTQVKP